MAHQKDVEREELLRQVESLHKKYAEGLNCFERVFLTLHGLLATDFPSETVALLSGFGGGVAGMRDGMCGAVSGGVAAIGLVYGRRKPPEGSRERMYKVPRDFVSRFKTRYGTIICRELIGDLLREGTAESEERRRQRCSQYTLSAAKMCAEALSKYRKMYAE